MHARTDFLRLTPHEILATHVIRLVGHVLSPFHFRGYWRFARSVGGLIDHRTGITLQISRHSSFRFLLSDPYWSRLLCESYRYEPEILHIVGSLKFPSDTQFLDCGANYGFWSVLLSERLPTTAIEASPSTFKHALANSILNGNRFCCVNRAVYSDSDLIVPFEQSAEHHAGAGINSLGSVEVKTIAIDDLASGSGAVLIKLDVEGAEIAALDGAARTLNSRPALIIYEDHGSDLSSRVTDHIISVNGLSVYYCRDDSTLIRLHTASEAAALKKNRKRGYNFFATQRGSVFDAQLSALL